MAPRIGFVSLGCPKALVDSERILTQLRLDGYEVAADYDSADAVVVNTCGFIESAITESLDAIGEALVENGRVIVTGCLGADAERVRAAHPGVQAVTGPHAYEEVMSAVRACVPPPPHDPLIHLVPDTGIKLTPRHYAWLKISEGCNHKCTFCIIPDLRGKLVSRAPADVLEEAERLVASGVRELLVISQDTSAYGIDLRYRTAFHRGRPIGARFADLCQELARLECQSRLHYVYPYPHVDDVIELMLSVEQAAQGAPGLLPYLDIPLQHANARILKLMRRPAGGEAVLERIARWRELRPGLRLRSTFIAGFPSETEAEFEELLNFLRAARLDHVGCFPYSPVEGARANAIEGAIPEHEREARAAELMRVQGEISAAILQEQVGEVCTVVVDEVGDEQLLARSWAQAPEIDGATWLRREDFPGAGPGEVLRVRITAADEHDLYGAPANS